MKRFFVLIILLSSSCDYASGSYPHAEIYKFDITEDQLVNAVEKFKTQYPQYCVPNNLGLIDGRSKDIGDHWYHIWFYYKRENKLVYTWIRGNKLALISINDGLELGNWKSINKDFSTLENKEQKEMFESLILNEIKKNF